MPTATLITFGGYLLLMVLIGLWAYKRTNNLSDYILGGRSLGPGVTALSAGASDMSSWLLMALPGAMYASGITEAWIALGLIIGAYLNWLIVAGRLRMYTEIADNSLTLPDFFENRFHDNSKILRVSAAIVIILFYTFYVTSGLVGGAKLFEQSFQLDYQNALLIGASVIVAYTFLGGFLAVSWTDFFQGTLMLLALVIAPITMVVEMNGLSNVFARIEEVRPGATDLTANFGWFAFFSLQAWGLGYFGQPHILSRFMGADNVSTIRSARRIGMSWMIFSLLGSMFVGLAAIGYFADDPNALNQLAGADSEKVFMLATNVLFNPWFAGFLLAAILAAIMSTIDSQLLVATSSLTEDIYKTFLRPNASEKELVWIGRTGVIVIAVVGVILAMNENSLIKDLVGYAWAGFGAAFGPVVIMSLLWQKMTRWGALAGMITGAVTVVVWEYLDKSTEIQAFDMYELLPGFILATIAILVVSKFSQVDELTYNQFDWFRSQFKKYES
ncbi:MAG: sodium/proline symporter PutP [Gammaproteobacteria bacterium]|nr:sodium/proline symporter PutP [Gammaproteobacteria bacterium]